MSQTDWFNGDWGFDRAEELHRQTNKRLSLNLLIQGAAMHSFLTGHHLVSEELDQVRRKLTKNYDRFSVCFALNYFIGDIIPAYGRPSRFWSRTDSKDHPFHNHRLFAEYGHDLWLSSKRFLIKRAWSKGVIAIPVFQWLQLAYFFMKAYFLERHHRSNLIHLAKKANSLMWGIDLERLDGALMMNVAFGNLNEPRTPIGRATRQGAIGYGGVELRQGKFHVVAKSWNGVCCSMN